MACIINLYDTINTGCPNNPFCDDVLPIDGYWTVYSSAIGFPIAFIVNGGVQVVDDDKEKLANGQYNPTLDLGNMPFGDYILEYHYGQGCAQTAFLHLFGLAVPCEAADLTVQVCDAITSTTFYELLTTSIANQQLSCVPTANGNWVLVGLDTGLTYSLSADDDGTNDTINPSTSTIGQYVFDYTYFPNYVDELCDTCEKTVRVTFDIIEAPSAGSGNNTVIC